MTRSEAIASHLNGSIGPHQALVGYHDCSYACACIVFDVLKTVAVFARAATDPPKAKGEALAAEIELTCQTIAVFARAASRAGRALLNIGLKVGNGPWATALPVFGALRTVRHYGGTFRGIAIRHSETEDTLVIDLDEPLNARVLAELASALNQEAIAQWSSGGGELRGPKAELWGPFDPSQFLLLDGRKLSEVDTHAK